MGFTGSIHVMNSIEIRTSRPTVLVTGATGAVGRHLATTLLARGAAVRAVIRKPEDANLPEAVEVVAGDLADASTLGRHVFEGVDRAFIFPAQGIDVFLDAAGAAGVHRFTVLSSLAAAMEFPRARLGKPAAPQRRRSRRHRSH
jgi:uncharacterized protein YbjT (DUF2867 family)